MRLSASRSCLVAGAKPRRVLPRAGAITSRFESLVSSGGVATNELPLAPSQRDSNPCLSCAEFSPISPGSYEGAPIVLTAQAQTRRLFARPRAVSGDLGTDSNVLFESCRLGQPRGLRRAEPALSYTGPEASNEVHADHDAP